MFNNTTIFKHFQSRDHKMTSLSIRSIVEGVLKFVHASTDRLVKRLHYDVSSLFGLFIRKLDASFNVRQVYDMLKPTDLMQLDIKAVYNFLVVYKKLYNTCSFCIFIGRELCVIEVHTH